MPSSVAFVFYNGRAAAKTISLPLRMENKWKIQKDISLGNMGDING